MVLVDQEELGASTSLALTAVKFRRRLDAPVVVAGLELMPVN